MKKEIQHILDDLIPLGFSKSESTEGQTSKLIFSKEDKECLVSWDKSSLKPSITYSDNDHLLGILDCEDLIRKEFNHLPENKNEALAWIMAAMPLESYLKVFLKKITPLINE